MTENDNADIKKMEDQERKRLEAYEAKKSLEKSKRNARKVAHEKLVCRTVAKSYLKDIKPNALVLLKDLAFISDQFKQETMHLDVMPWLMQQSEIFVKQMENINRYPNTVIAKYIDEASVTHIQHVNEHIKKRENIRQASVKAEEDRLAAKLQRQRDRATKKKLE